MEKRAAALCAELAEGENENSGDIIKADSRSIRLSTLTAGAKTCAAKEEGKAG